MAFLVQCKMPCYLYLLLVVFITFTSSPPIVITRDHKSTFYMFHRYKMHMDENWIELLFTNYIEFSFIYNVALKYGVICMQPPASHKL